MDSRYIEKEIEDIYNILKLHAKITIKLFKKGITIKNIRLCYIILKKEKEKRLKQRIKMRFALRKNYKYKFEKTGVNSNSIKQYSQNYISRTIDEQEEPIYAEFLRVMLNHGKYDCCSNFIDNIPMINLSYSSLDDGVGGNVNSDDEDDVAGYVHADDVRDEITLCYNTEDLDRETIFHELFHISSFRKNEEFYTLGFHFRKKDNSLVNCGRGINEGYTELLTHRYTDYSSSSSVPYQINEEIARLVEMIVGQDEMEKLYFSANLDGLIEKLGSKIGIDNAINIIKDCDTLITSLKVFENAETYFSIIDKHTCNEIIQNDLFLLFDTLVDTLIEKHLNDEIISYKGKHRYTDLDIFVFDEDICNMDIFDSDSLPDYLQEVRYLLIDLYSIVCYYSIDFKKTLIETIIDVEKMAIDKASKLSSIK